MLCFQIITQWQKHNNQTILDMDIMTDGLKFHFTLISITSPAELHHSNTHYYNTIIIVRYILFILNSFSDKRYVVNYHIFHRNMMLCVLYSSVCILETLLTPMIDMHFRYWNETLVFCVWRAESLMESSGQLIKGTLLACAASGLNSQKLWMWP